MSNNPFEDHKIASYVRAMEDFVYGKRRVNLTFPIETYSKLVKIGEEKGFIIKKGPLKGNVIIWKVIKYLLDTYEKEHDA